MNDNRRTALQKILGLGVELDPSGEYGGGVVGKGEDWLNNQFLGGGIGKLIKFLIEQKGKDSPPPQGGDIFDPGTGIGRKQDNPAPGTEHWFNK